MPIGKYLSFSLHFTKLSKWFKNFRTSTAEVYVSLHISIEGSL